MKNSSRRGISPIQGGFDQNRESKGADAPTWNKPKYGTGSNQAQYSTGLKSMPSADRKKSQLAADLTPIHVKVEPSSNNKDAQTLRELKQKIADGIINVVLANKTPEQYYRFKEALERGDAIDGKVLNCLCHGPDCGGIWGGYGQPASKLRGDKKWIPCKEVFEHRTKLFESRWSRLNDERELFIELLGKKKFDKRLMQAKEGYDYDMKKLQDRREEFGLDSKQPITRPRTGGGNRRLTTHYQP